MRVTYGYTVKGEDDPMITIPFTSMDNFSKATEPGMWMVDLIPQRAYASHQRIWTCAHHCCSQVSPRVDTRGNLLAHGEEVEAA